MISTGIFLWLSVPEHGRKKNHEWASACAKGWLTPSQPAALPRFYHKPSIYIYPTPASLTRAMFAGKTRARQRRAYTSPSRPSKFSRGRQVRGPSAAKSSRESARVAKKVGWQRASFQFQRDFVTWHKGQAERRRWNGEEKKSRRKGRTNRPFRRSLFPARHARAPIVPRYADRFDCSHLSSSSVHWEMLLNAHCMKYSLSLS